MSIIVSRRDAIKGAMAATAALAATPYLGNLIGAVHASPVKAAPATSGGAAASAAGTGLPAQSGDETTVLLIKGDLIKSYSGLRTVNVQDAALASRLRSAVHARFD
jgi:hypothetical protein